MLKLTFYVILIASILPMNGYGQWNYPAYNIEPGSYDNCPNDKINCYVPSHITSQIDVLNTSIFFNLLSSDIRARDYIELNPGISISANCTEGSTFLHINEDLNCFAQLINAPSGTVLKDEKIEIGVVPSSTVMDAINNFFSNTNNPKINPYNPDHSEVDYIDVVATFTHATDPSANRTIYGFFYRDYVEDFTNDVWHEVPTNFPFRIRFAPPIVGEYKVIVELFSNPSHEGGPTISQCADFYCLPNSASEGPLVVGHHEHNLKFKDSQRSFFGVGINMGYVHGQYESNSNLVLMPSEFKTHRNQFNSFIAAKGNYARIDCENIDYNPEWLKLNVYDKYEWPISSGQYHNRQNNMWEFDKIISIAELNKIFLQVVLDGGSSFNILNYYTSPPSNWNEKFFWPWNPYHTEMGFTLGKDFLTAASAQSSSAFKQYSKRIRYIMSRWGYTNQIANFEMMNEVDWQEEIAINQSSSMSGTITNFINNLIDYAKFDLGYTNHLYSASYASHEWGANDFNSTFYSTHIDLQDHHDYGNRKDQNLVKRASAAEDLYSKTFSQGKSKPFIFGELGSAPAYIDQCTDVNFHNTIWSSAFMGSFGTGLNWWIWDNAPYFSHITQVADFFEHIDFESNKFEPKHWKLGYWNPRDYLLENYELVNFSKTRAMGWLHNATAYWYNIAPNCGSQPPYDDSFVTTARILPNNSYKIVALQPLRRYQVEFYRPESNTLYYTDNYRAKIWGFIRHSVGGMFDDRDDYSYKAYSAGNNFRYDEEEVETDTLDCFEDTISVDMIFENDSLRLLNYTWIVDSVIFYYGSITNVIIADTGIHFVSLIVHDSLGWADTLSQSVYKPFCDSSINFGSERKSQEVKSIEGDKLISVFPNPNSGNFNIFIKPKFEFAKLRIYDILGNQIYLMQIKTNVINNLYISKLTPGIYLFKFNLDEEIINKKIIIE